MRALEPEVVDAVWANGGRSGTARDGFEVAVLGATRVAAEPTSALTGSNTAVLAAFGLALAGIGFLLNRGGKRLGRRGIA